MLLSAFLPMTLARIIPLFCLFFAQHGPDIVPAATIGANLFHLSDLLITKLQVRFHSRHTLSTLFFRKLPTVSRKCSSGRKAGQASAYHHQFFHISFLWFPLGFAISDPRLLHSVPIAW